jgi:predicted nucleotide-binding protein (sugar kinase/HSP70/actin superfamily)
MKEKRFSVRITDNYLIQFVNMQSNLNDTIKYLIEKEIAENGMRNLQNFIPSKRSEKFFNVDKEKTNE